MSKARFSIIKIGKKVLLYKKKDVTFSLILLNLLKRGQNFDLELAKKTYIKVETFKTVHTVLCSKYNFGSLGQENRLISDSGIFSRIILYEFSRLI